MSVSINGTSGLVFNDSSTQNTAATGFGFKNRIINGAMMIDQRNAGASVTANGGYYLDRWEIEASQSSKLTIQQQTSVVPTGFTHAMALTSSSSYTVGSSEVFDIRHIVEGFNVADLGWGTANAATVTLSFWVRSSLTGTFGGALCNGDNNRSYPFTYTISSANTWEQKSITVAGDTTGTWGKTNGRGIAIRFGLGMGSTFSGAAGSWAAADYRSVTGATSVVGTNGATFYITGVQLEKGSTATSFDYRPYGTELALCQRYCLVDSSLGYNYTAFGTGMVFSTTGASFTRQFPVPMRVAPASVTVSSVSGFIVDCGGTAVQSTNVAISTANTTMTRVTGTVASGLTAGQGCTLVNDASGTTRTIAYNAEL